MIWYLDDADETLNSLFDTKREIREDEHLKLYNSKFCNKLETFVNHLFSFCCICRAFLKNVPFLSSSLHSRFKLFEVTVNSL